MTSWDIKATFYGLSPHIEELRNLAKKEKFSNIESINRIEGTTTYLIIVNDRGLNQKKFEEKVRA